ncbi:MAG TPA: AAA family ATPase [Trebonia sp.]|nr:AAA family ATPase [Trebonia sp.]
MTLVLLSGRPGAGKTEFCKWLASECGFACVETDAESRWRSLLQASSSPEKAAEAYNRARDLGPKVVIEWGFPVSALDCVRQLRTAGFDAWWFDGEESGAREGYIQRRGCSPSVMRDYSAQVQTIEARLPEIEHFYGDHVIRTVSTGRAYKTSDEIASIMFPDL